MKLILMRHGFAGIPKDVHVTNWKWSKENLRRPLQSEGRDAALGIARWMFDHDEIPSRIEHSPTERTRETAKIVFDHLRKHPDGKRIQLVEQQNLFIDKPVDEYVKRLCDDKSNKRVMLVGHSDNIPPALRALNWVEDKLEVDQFATAELRCFDFCRKDYTWDELYRVLPSDMGSEDLY